MTEAEVIAIFEEFGLDPDVHFDGTPREGGAAGVAERFSSAADLRAMLKTAPGTSEALPRNAKLVKIGGTYRVIWSLGDNLGFAWYDINAQQLENIYDTATPNAHIALSNMGQFEGRFGNNYWGNVAEINLKREDPWEDLKERIFQQFGFVPGLDDPEIRRLMIQGHFEDWNQNQFTVEYANTEYFQETTNRQRAWFGLSETEKTSRIGKQAAELTAEYFNLYGRTIDQNDPGIQDDALKLASGQMTLSQWRYETRLGAESEPESPAARRIREEQEEQLAEGNQIENLTSFSGDQWRQWVGPVDMPQEFASRWGNDLASGVASEADLESYLKEIATSRWQFKPPNLTWSDWSSTYKSQIRNTLEIGSLSDSDSLLQSILSQDLTGVDLEQVIRADDRFKSTQAMFGELSSLANDLGRSFGFIK